MWYSLQGRSLPQTLATGVTVEERPKPYRNTLAQHFDFQVFLYVVVVLVCFYMVTRFETCPSGGGNLLVGGKTGAI